MSRRENVQMSLNKHHAVDTYGKTFGNEPSQLYLISPSLNFCIVKNNIGSDSTLCDHPTDTRGTSRKGRKKIISAITI